MSERGVLRAGGDLWIVYLGMFGDLSALPLRRLLKEGEQVRAVVVPGSRPAPRQGPPFERLLPPPEERPRLPLLRAIEEKNIVEVAWESGIPAYQVARPNNAAWLQEIASYAPDLVVVSCFPQRLGSAFLRVPRLGVLNLHPSLLPAYRGPDPIFWVFRQGESRTGVTVHFMEERLDAGDIVGQREVEVPEGIGGDALRRMLAEEGGDLLVEVLRALRAETLSRRPQDPSAGSYFPAPKPQDFEVPTSWPARRAFNFIRGVGGWGPVTILAGGERIRARLALSYSEEERMGEDVRREGSVLALRFNPGVVRVEG